MQLSPYEQHHHYPHSHWDYEDPVRRQKRKRILRIVVLAVGAIGIMVATFTAVAGYKLLTSNDAKMIAQAARDKSRATALDFSTKAKCDRLVSEAQAVGDPLPPCAARLDKQKAASESSSMLDAGVSLAKQVLLAAAGD